MVMPVMGSGPDHEAMVGDSYGAVFVAGVSRDDVVERLEDARFTGWVAPTEGDWTVVIGDPGAGVVAGKRKGVPEVGALFAKRSDARVLAVRVRRDRDLALIAWQDGEETARYWSDPSQEPDADREVLSDPVGADGAGAFLALVGREGDEEALEKLTEVLEEELDTDSVFESERLRHVLDILGLPTWIVAAPTLPKDLPTGPPTSSMTRLRAGRIGAAGVLLGPGPAKVRSGRTAPPIMDDPPRGDTPGPEYWML